MMTAAAKKLRSAMTACALVVLLPFLAAPAVAGAGETASVRREFAAAAGWEAEMARFPIKDWGVERLRELARSIATLPDEVATRALWLCAMAPSRVDVTNIFANALESPSPAIRQTALSILVGGTSSDARRLLMNTVSLEKDEEVISYIIKGLAALPLKRAVRSLMDVMFLPGIRGAAVEQAAGQLRELTGAQVTNNSGDWRDWWLDNEERYEE